MTAARDEHAAKAREMLGYADAMASEDRGTTDDLSLLMEANAHAILALVDAISELTEQASPTQHLVKARILSGVE